MPLFTDRCDVGITFHTLQGKMKVVNTLLAVARRAKDCGMAADIDAPPKIANAFKGLEEKFGKKFEHTANVNSH